MAIAIYNVIDSYNTCKGTADAENSHHDVNLYYRPNADSTFRKVASARYATGRVKPGDANAYTDRPSVTFNAVGEYYVGPNANSIRAEVRERDTMNNTIRL